MIENRLFLRLKVMREIPLFVGFLELKSYNMRIQHIPVLGQINRIKLYSGLYHVLEGIAANHSFCSLPHFVAFIMFVILQSEESEIEINTKYSSD